VKGVINFVGGWNGEDYLKRLGLPSAAN